MANRDRVCTNPMARATAAEAFVEAVRCLEGKWKIVILSHLFTNPKMRFSELERAVDGISQRILIRQLKGLEEDGLIERTAFPEVPPRVEYALSDVGYALAPAIEALVAWAGLLSKRKHPRRKGM